MRQLTDMTTASVATTTSVGYWYSMINQGLAFFLLVLSIVLTAARLWSWWEERQRKKEGLPYLYDEDEKDRKSPEGGFFY